MYLLAQGVFHEADLSVVSYNEPLSSLKVLNIAIHMVSMKLKVILGGSITHRDSMCN